MALRIVLFLIVSLGSLSSWASEETIRFRYKNRLAYWGLRPVWRLALKRIRHQGLREFTYATARDIELIAGMHPPVPDLEKLDTHDKLVTAALDLCPFGGDRSAEEDDETREG